MKKIFTLIASLMMVLSMSAATKTIYCKMAHDWWYADGAAVGAHYWTEGGAGTNWPGVRMTPVTGESDLWSIDIDTDKYKQIIFTRVNGSGTIADYGAKTADLTIPTDDKNLYTITSTSPVWGDPGVKGEWSTYTPNAPKTYKDITFTITANAAPQIHYWDGGDKMVGSVWENLPTMTATGNANEYTYTVKDVDEAKGVKYLLKIGNIQTADQHTTENVTADFKDLMPEVYVKGVTGWTGDGHKMTIADDCASASVTITLAANLTADLKLIIGGAWMGDTKNAITKDNNSSVFDTNGQNGSIKTDIAGDYIFTYTYADKTLTVTYPTEEIEVAVDCYVTGNTALTGEDWVLNSENLKMTKVEGTEKYTYTFTALPANTAFELKVVYANSQKGFSSLSEAIDGVTANGDNICFTLEETGDVTVTYDAETEKIALTGNFAIPVTYDYYIAGTLAGGWSATQQGMEKEGDVYKHTFSDLNAGTYEFKITDGQFNSADDNTHEHTTLGAAYVEVSYNEGNIKIDTDQAINLTVIFDATEDKITFEGLTETTPAKCYLMGIGGDWITGIEMEEDGEQFKLLCQPIAEDDQFKFKHGDIWSDGVENYDFPGINWVDDDNDGDYHITLPAGNYNFYYKKNDNKVWIEAATGCPATVTIEDPIASMSTYTGVEENDGVWSKVYTAGDEVTIGVDQLGDGWLFAYWTVDGEKIFTEEYTFTVTKDVTITANYGMAMDVEFDNMELDLESWIVTAGPEAGFGIELTLGIDVEGEHPKGFGLVDGSSISLGGEELELVTGYFTSVDQYAPSAEAVVFAVYEEMLMAFVCTMTAAPAPVHNIVVENATIDDQTETSGFLFMNGTWSDGTETYPVQAEIPGFDPNIASATYMVTITVGGRGDDDPWLGSAEGEVTVTVNAGLVTLTGSLVNGWTGFKADVTISGTLPAVEEPEVTEITLTEGDNRGALATEGVVTVTVNRSFEQGNLYTIALPFTINNAASVFGNGTVVYNFANLAYDKTNEEYILGFTTVGKIEAGKPYLIQPGQDVSSFVAENVTLSSATSVSQKVIVDKVEKTATMTAVLSKTTTGGSYWLAEDRYLYNDKVDMPALRALFVLPTTPSGMPARARVALKEDAATGVEDLFTTDAPVKVIVNGQLIIIRDGVKYNVQGQLVK